MQVSCLKNLRNKNYSLKNTYNIYCILFIFRKKVQCAAGTQNVYIKLDEEEGCTLIENNVIEFEIKCEDDHFYYEKGGSWKKILSIECTQPKPGLFKTESL